MAYNLLINGVYWGYNPLTNLLLSSWDIQVQQKNGEKKICQEKGPTVSLISIHQEFQVPKMEGFLNLIFGHFGDGFSLT